MLSKIDDAMMAPSHNLRQCWPISLTPYVATRATMTFNGVNRYGAGAVSLTTMKTIDYRPRDYILPYIITQLLNNLAQLVTNLWLRPGLVKCHWSINMINTLRPRQNEHHFADDIFKFIFLNEKVRISLKIHKRFVPKDPFNDNPALIQKMAWRRTGDKP